MDEEEFFTWLESLSPEEQEQALYEFGYQGANQLGPSFGAFAPEMPMAGYDLATLGGGVNLPEFTTKGAVDPYDLTQMAKRINVGQDIATGYVDNALAMLGGPGSYDVSAFQDTVTPAKRMSLPGQARIQRYATGGGYEAYLADAIGNRGMSPANAIAEMWGKLELLDDPDADLSDEDRATLESVRFSLPSAEAKGGLQLSSGGTYSGVEGREGRQGYNEQGVWSVAQDMFDATLEDEMVRETGWIDETGQFGTPGAVYEAPPEVTPSTAAKWYRDRGLPLPTETYDSDKYLSAILDAQFPNREKANTERQQREMEAQLKATVLGAGEKKARADEDELTKAYEEAVVRPAGAGLRGGGGQPMEAVSNVPMPRGRGLPMGPNAPSRLQLDMTPQRIDAALQSMASSYRPELAPTAPFINVDKEGNISQLYDFGGTNQENAGATLAQRGMGDVVAGLFGRGEEEPTDRTRRMTRSDVEKLGRTTQQMRTARRQADRALFNERYRTTPDQLAEARAMGQMAGLVRSGRTPLQDAIAQRALVQRSMGMIG